MESVLFVPPLWLAGGRTKDGSCVPEPGLVWSDFGLGLEKACNAPVGRSIFKFKHGQKEDNKKEASASRPVSIKSNNAVIAGVRFDFLLVT